MTPKAIETGRRLASNSVTVDVASGQTVLLASADAARVACAMSCPGSAFISAVKGVTIGIKVDGVLVPLTTLNAAMGACYLSVDKIGNAVCQDIFADNQTTLPISLGVTSVRQYQPLE